MKIITQKGIWVSSSFTAKFGSKDIKPAKTVPSFKKSEKIMTDSEIKSELGAQECTLADVAAFLKDPPKGCDDGYLNLFYIGGFVVYVFWYADCGGWGVRGWSLDDVRWDAGSRVFSRNFSPLEKPSETLNLEKRVAELEANVKKLIAIVNIEHL